MSRTWLRWVIASVLLVWCGLFLDLRETLKILGRVSSSSIIFILGLCTVDRVLMAWKWLFLLRGLQVQISLSTLIGLYYQGSFTGTFLPTSLGGDMLRAYWVSRRSGATHEVYASLLMEKLIGFMSALNWAFLGVVVVAFSVLPQMAVHWAAAALFATLLLNSLFLVSLRPSCCRFIQRNLARVSPSRLLEYLKRLYDAYSQYGERRSVLLWNGLLTITEHSLQMLIVFAMAKSLGITADTVLFFAVTAVYLLIYRFPVSPDGWGVGEITAVGLFGLIGVPAESGFALAFLAHVLQTIVVLPGFWFLWRSGLVIDKSSRWRWERSSP